MRVTNGEVIEVLKAARHLILKGWTKEYSVATKVSRRTGKEYYCYCATGAISRAGYLTSNSYATEVARATLRDFLKDTGRPRNIPQWNDAPGTKKVEVLKTFSDLIAQLEGK